MKKLFLFVSILAVSLVGCSDDDENNSVTVNEANIMKKWYYKEYVVAGQTFPYVNESCGRDYIELLANDVYNEYTVWGCDPLDAETDSGSWSLSGTTLTANVSGYTESGTVSGLTSSTMQITYQDDWDEDGTLETVKVNFTSN